MIQYTNRPDGKRGAPKEAAVLLGRAQQGVAGTALPAAEVAIPQPENMATKDNRKY
jgi:hypothetical protein